MAERMMTKQRKTPVQELGIKLVSMTKVARQAIEAVQYRTKGTESVPSDLLDVSRAIREVTAVLTETADQIEHQAKVVSISNWKSMEEEELLKMVVGIADTVADLSTVTNPENAPYQPDQVKKMLTTSDNTVKDVIASLSSEQWQRLMEMRSQDDN